MPAHTPRASLSPLREAGPIFFCRADQRPSVAASDMVSFEGSEYEILDDSVSSSMNRQLVFSLTLIHKEGNI